MKQKQKKQKQTLQNPTHDDIYITKHTFKLPKLEKDLFNLAAQEMHKSNPLSCSLHFFL